MAKICCRLICILRSEEDDKKPDPTPQHANSRVGADEHQRQELVLRAKYKLMS